MKLFNKLISAILLIAVLIVPQYINASMRDSTLWKVVCRQDFKKMAFVAAPIMVTGVATKLAMPEYKVTQRGESEKFNAFSITEFAPAVAMIGMKAAGVESRSSWGRMLTADAFSGIMTVGIVEGLKRGVGEERPNGENHKSFPSGHSAFAFMSATMMAREYGWRSPWYSIGAYSLATATAASRVAQNYHWAADVVTGAGIGIFATQLGYLFSDLIFKNKGLSYGYILSDEEWQDDAKFELLINSGISIPLNNLKVYGVSYNLATGTKSALDGNFWFSRWLGAYVGAGVQSLSLSRDKDEYIDPVNNVQGCLGLTTKVDFGEQLSLRGRIGGGVSHYMDLENEESEIQVGGTSGLIDAQASLFYKLTETLCFGVNVGYQNTKIKIALPLEPWTHKNMSAISVGFSTNVSF